MNLLELLLEIFFNNTAADAAAVDQHFAATILV